MYLISDNMNFVWMNGSNMYIPQSQSDHTASIDPVFFGNSLPQVETIPPITVSILTLI